MHTFKGYNDQKVTHTMIPGPITSWSKSLLRYNTKSMAMDVVVVDKMNLMKEEKDGPPSCSRYSMSRTCGPRDMIS